MTNIVNNPTIHVDLAQQYHQLITLVLDAVPSPHTKRAYNRALRDFIDWYLAQDQPLTKATVHRYRSHLEDNEFSASNINQRLRLPPILVLRPKTVTKSFGQA